MNIAFVGNFKHSHCSEVHFKKTLEGMGHAVLPLQEDAFDAETIFLASKGCDLFMWVRTWGIKGDVNLLLQNLENEGIVTISYHLDLYIGISRETKMEEDPFWRTKYVFTPDGGHREEFYEKGINHYFIRPAVFKEECKLGQPDLRMMHDVVFVGSRLYHKEWPYRERLISWLEQTYGDRFAHYGNQSKIQECLRGKQLNNLYASAKVVVGDSLCVGFNTPYYWSDRTCETLGRGGFLVHPYIEGMEGEFQNGRHLCYYEFDNFAMLKTVIDSMIKMDEVRESIRLAGHQRVVECCTYEDRFKQIFGILAYKEPSIEKALQK